MTEELPFCECGCGERVRKKGHRFIWGHNGRVLIHTLESIAKMSKPKRKSKLKPPLCECGCGKPVTKFGNRFLKGHNRRRILHTPKSKEQMSKSAIGKHNGDKNPMYGLYGKNHPAHIFGKNDIVEHHVAYDFKRPETLVVKIIRSFHGQIHHPKGIPLTKRGYSLID